MKFNVKAIILILGLAAIAGLVTLNPIVRNQVAKLIPIDTYLCSKFPNVACEFAARLTNDAKKKRELALVACTAGWIKCRTTAEELKTVHWADSIAHFSAHCKGGNGISCTDAGKMLEKSPNFDSHQTQAANMYRAGCEANDARGCTRLGNLYQSGKGLPKSLE
ncbi:MAG: hypothetical protein ABJM83_06845, partial [Paracoccaceae bacterium]